MQTVGVTARLDGHPTATARVHLTWDPALPVQVTADITCAGEEEQWVFSRDSLYRALVAPPGHVEGEADVVLAVSDGGAFWLYLSSEDGRATLVMPLAPIDMFLANTLAACERGSADEEARMIRFAGDVMLAGLSS